MPSIREDKDTSAPSVFRPAALLREARRQKGLAAVNVPQVCILDPDGDIVRRLQQSGQSRIFEGLALLPHAARCIRARRPSRRHRRQCGRRAVRGLDRGRAFRIRLPLVVERDFGWPDRPVRSASVLCHHRPRFARRRDQLSLRAAIGIQRRRPGSGGDGGGSAEGRRSACLGRDRVGPRMLRFAKRRTPSRQPGQKAFSQSRWKQPLCMRSRARRAFKCCASPMSPTRWARQNEISKKVKRMAPPTHWRCSKS